MTKTGGGTKKQGLDGPSQSSQMQDSEATSNETLSDIEASEKESGTDDLSNDPGPSPDGLLDDPAEINDAGPM